MPKSSTYISEKYQHCLIKAFLKKKKKKGTLKPLFFIKITMKKITNNYKQLLGFTK